MEGSTESVSLTWRSSSGLEVPPIYSFQIPAMVPWATENAVRLASCL
jgi:hypothetical protein